MWWTALIISILLYESVMSFPLNRSPLPHLLCVTCQRKASLLFTATEPQLLVWGQQQTPQPFRQQIRRINGSGVKGDGSCKNRTEKTTLSLLER